MRDSLLRYAAGVTYVLFILFCAWLPTGDEDYVSAKALFDVAQQPKAEYTHTCTVRVFLKEVNHNISKSHYIDLVAGTYNIYGVIGYDKDGNEWVIPWSNIDAFKNLRCTE